MSNPPGLPADGLNACQHRRERIGKQADYYKLKPLPAQQQKGRCRLCNQHPWTNQVVVI